MATYNLDELKAGEKKFVESKTMQLLVQWAEDCFEHGEIKDLAVDIEEPGNIYVEFAFKRGWIGKRSPHVLTQGGFAKAARFLV